MTSPINRESSTYSFREFINLNDELDLPEDPTSNCKEYLNPVPLSSRLKRSNPKIKNKLAFIWRWIKA